MLNANPIAHPHDVYWVELVCQINVRQSAIGLPVKGQQPAVMLSKSGDRHDPCQRQLVIVPQLQAASTPVDPTFGLGQQPVSCNLPDAAEHPDRYLLRACNAIVISEVDPKN